MVGITAAFHCLVRHNCTDFSGGIIKEWIEIIKDGTYYHCQQEGDRLNLAKAFMKRVNADQIDFDKEYDVFENNVKEYEEFLLTKEEDYTKETFLKLINFYEKMWNLAYTAVDSMDAIDVLDENKKEQYSKWIFKVRKRAELVYKRGETEFLPKYLKWFAENISPEYTAEELNYLVFTEMEDFIKHNKPLPSKEELHKRSRYFFIRHTFPDKIEYCSGEEAKKIMDEKEFFKEEDYSNVKEIKGRIAYQGKIQGEVCLVQSRTDIKKFKEGYILVSQMTDPNYLPIMEKASAFVTDEGGALCHAAIVAREMKKPCIIGTKIATKVLKDGDLVEVDADNGVVRKLE